ncbi:hypothetical protein AB0M29_22765 [Streptomyces sp. NPDC051976]|uniref:hypothetical protein n=1 Tax=Streptomyces sp. NPDC051976 TaxID=3154947 RepID=UPI00341699A7
MPPGVAETAQLPAISDADDGLAPTGGGRRAARRAERGGVRARRGRQQRVAVYGVGAVAVIGALTMFSVAALSGGGSGSPTPPRPGLVDLSPTATSGVPEPDAGGGDPAGGPSGSASHQSTTSAPPSTTATRTASAPATTHHPSHPTATATTPHTPGSPTPKPPPSATPSPTKTCQRVLWWCQ